MFIYLQSLQKKMTMAIIFQYQNQVKLLFPRKQVQMTIYSLLLVFIGQLEFKWNFDFLLP